MLPRYLYNSVAFLQILKAFAPVVLMVLLFALRLEKPTTPLVLSILVIAAGTVVAVGTPGPLRVRVCFDGVEWSGVEWSG